MEKEVSESSSDTDKERRIHYIRWDILHMFMKEGSNFE